VTASGPVIIIVVGGDLLALDTAQELCTLGDHRVVVLWQGDAEYARAVESIGAVFVSGRPDSTDGLERAGVRQAVTILALSNDDQLNLHAALLARDANPRIRIVLRQFNRTLARKIEQNLPDCSVLSLAWYSATTYAAAAIDPTCFHGLQFPDQDGPLTGFAVRTAGAARVEDLTVAEAEAVLAARIVAVDGATGISAAARLAGPARLVLFGEIARLAATVPPRREARRRRSSGRAARAFARRIRQQRRFNPILARLVIAALAVSFLGTLYFHRVFRDSWLDAAYFVVTTMTTTGYGDLTPHRDSLADVVVAMALMLGGITFSGLFIAFGASLLTRIQWVRMQGLRPVRRRSHIIVCGAGSIGSEVIDLLLDLGKELVVIEAAPDPVLVERARERHFDLLTGDASRDSTLDLCRLESADGLVALTNVDTLNLEIALGARARNPTMPIVLRIADAGFAVSIARHFDFETTFSAAALAAPAFVGLTRFPGARGRIAFAGRNFAIAEIDAGELAARGSLPDAIPLAVARGDAFTLARDYSDLGRGDRLLLLLPVPPLRTVGDPAVPASPYHEIQTAAVALAGPRRSC
jgi:Trk K+ transport system NAD-binding subunit